MSVSPDRAKPAVKAKPIGLRSSPIMPDQTYSDFYSQNLLPDYSPPATPTPQLGDKILASKDVPLFDSDTLLEPIPSDADESQLHFENANRLVIAIDFGTTFTGKNESEMRNQRLQNVHQALQWPLRQVTKQTSQKSESKWNGAKE
jgi:hypothetical protein